MMTSATVSAATSYSKRISFKRSNSQGSIWYLIPAQMTLSKMIATTPLLKQVRFDRFFSSTVSLSRVKLLSDKVESWFASRLSFFNFVSISGFCSFF